MRRPAAGAAGGAAVERGRSWRCYRTTVSRVGYRILTAEDPLTPELPDALALIC